MKKICLVTFAMLLILKGFSQTPFAKPEASWCFVTIYPTQTTYGDNVSFKDTSIQGIGCTLVGGVGCLFVQNDTVFNISDNGTIGFLYNYAAQAGDIWHIYTPHPYSIPPTNDTIVPVHVDSVSVRNIRGNNRRIIFTSIIDTPFTQFGYTLGTVLEGVGTTYYFRPGPWGLVDDGIPYRSCFKDSTLGAISEEEGHITLLDSCVCHVWMGDKTITSEKSILLSPNPATTSFTLQLSSAPNTPTYFQLYDAIGRQVRQEEIIATSTTLYRNNLPKGIYFWQLLTRQNVLQRGKLVME